MPEYDRGGDYSMSDSSRNVQLEKIIKQSSWCQRNWDLSKSISERDIQTLKYAVTHCPSKQNRVFYKALFIQDRNIIQAIHDSSDSFTIRWDPHEAVTNTQTLANLLVVFVRDRDENTLARTEKEYDKGVIDGKTKTDEDRSVGIAGAYLAFAANMLGYRTGFYNILHNKKRVESILNTPDVLLSVGVGFHNEDVNIRQSHVWPEFTYPSFEKNIQVEDM